MAVEVHQFGTSAGPRTILDAEPASGSRPVTLGDAARLYSTSLIFRQGPYLVRLVAFEEGAGVGPALLSLGRAIAARLP